MTQQQECEISNLTKQHLECHPEDETHNTMSEAASTTVAETTAAVASPDYRVVRHYSN